MRRRSPEVNGNYIWRIETPSGTVLQKHYGERGGFCRRWLGEWGTRMVGLKTSSLAAGRCATEREMIALWARSGVDVPRDLSSDFSHLSGPKTLVLEYVEGDLLVHRLADTSLSRRAQGELFGSFIEGWAKRHCLALEQNEPGLIQEHGSLWHVIVSGSRFVTIDLENAYQASKKLTPLLYREIAAYTRSLQRGRYGDGFDYFLSILVEAYPERDRLRETVNYYLHHPNPVRRSVWRMDRWRDQKHSALNRKYDALESLQVHLDEQN